MVGLSVRRACQAGAALILGQVRAHGDFPGRLDCIRSAADLVSLAVRGRLDHRRGGKRAGVPGDWRLRPSNAKAARGAFAPRLTLEVRLQVDQVDRALY